MYQITTTAPAGLDTKYNRVSWGEEIADTKIITRKCVLFKPLAYAENKSHGMYKPLTSVVTAHARI